MGGINQVALKRLKKEYDEIEKEANELSFRVYPLEDNFLEWHFTLQGPSDSPFEHGMYHGRLIFPADYPFSAPNLMFITPSGRFQVNTKICLTVTGFHPEHWQPAWGVRTMLIAIRDHFTVEDKGAIGYLGYSTEDRLRLAIASRSAGCSACHYEAPPLSPEYSARIEQAAIIASQPNSTNYLYYDVLKQALHSDIHIARKNQTILSMVLPECPDDLKYLLPYLQRSSELKGREPLIAYYCGYYAANLALTKGVARNQSNDAFLNALLNDLEEQKRLLIGDPALEDQEKARAQIMQFAMKIFLAADNEDRSGHATKKTGRLFLVASQFLEVTRTFGDLPEEIEERIKYAKWKAADIVKAINEGKQPQAGPPRRGSEGESNIEHRPQSPTLSEPNQPHLPHSQPKSSIFTESNHYTLPSLSGQFPINRESPLPETLSSHSDTTGYAAPVSPVLDPATLAQAEKYARYTVSAIQFEDVPTAIQNLELCLETLRDLQRQRRQ